jgi:hypothetical protein
MRRIHRIKHTFPRSERVRRCDVQAVGAAKKDAGRAFGFVTIRVPKADEEVTRQTFTFAVDKKKLSKAEVRDGHYLLRSNLTAEDPGVLWERYVQLTQIEAAFKTMKSELGPASDLSPTRPSRGSSHSRRVPRLLPAGHAEEPAASSGTGTDAASSHRNVDSDADAGRDVSHH